MPIAEALRSMAPIMGSLPYNKAILEICDDVVSGASVECGDDQYQIVSEYGRANGCGGGKCLVISLKCSTKSQTITKKM